jgi:hypothetical protein
LGFEGRVEYRHVLSGSGAAQYGVGHSPDQDLLIVFAQAFERDADPSDFSLEAIIAHERGHQMLVRHPMLTPIVARGIGRPGEEILASLIGSLIAQRDRGRQDLYYKALYDAIEEHIEPSRAVQLLHDLRVVLEKAIC